MDIKNIYLISNDTNLKEEKIDNIYLTETDLVVLFNHANPLQFTKIKNHTNKCLFLNGTENFFHGYDEAIQNYQYYKKLFLHIPIDMQTLIRFKKYIINLKKLYDTRIINRNNNITNYPINKFPTIGFVAFFWFKMNYPNNEINLINFTGNGSSKEKKIWAKHDYILEQNYYKQNNINMI